MLFLQLQNYNLRLKRPRYISPCRRPFQISSILTQRNIPYWVNGGDRNQQAREILGEWGGIYLLREAIRFKVEQRMEGARKDRHVTQNTMPHLVAQ